MKKKKVSKKKNISKLIDLHMYGIYDKNRHTLTKISLEQEEIQMEIALAGGLEDGLIECEFDILLKL